MDRLWINGRLATMTSDDLGIEEDGVVACCAGRIVYAGAAANGPSDAREVIDCEGRWITPGLIDCHTHLIHAGNRANEFAQRLAGASYAEIARAGGGILSTMRATRAASEEELIEQGLPRLDALIAEGVTTVEIKSGYGLELESELKMLRAARALSERRPISVTTTFLGAHMVPPGQDPDDYLDSVIAMLPEILPYADAVDAFCETIAFSAAQVDRLFAASPLPVKLHAEQLSNNGGTLIAGRHNALSADHLEYLDETGIAAMAAARTVAVLLPGAYYFTRETRKPPVEALHAAGVPIAIATDCNPGTAPLTSLLLVMNMAATLFGLSIEQCLIGVTRNAARALGRADEIGTLEGGKSCDLAIWNIDHPAELVYRIGFNPLHARIWRGQ